MKKLLDKKRYTDPEAEYSEAQRRYDSNMKLIEEITKAKPAAPEKAKAVAEQIEKYGEARYDYVGALLDAQAMDKVVGRFIEMVEWRNNQEDYDGDLLDVYHEYIEQLKDSLVKYYRHDGISRSTNQLSNLMEDVEKSVEARFIDKMHWWIY